MEMIVDNKEIGKYLNELILDQYSKKTLFYKEYVMTKYNVGEKDIGFNDLVKNEANRFNQIIHGNKGIQITDLPICSNLLGVSIEDILYARRKYNKRQIHNFDDCGICPECGYEFNYFNEVTCPYCGSLNPKNNKNIKLTEDYRKLRSIRKKIHKLSDKMKKYEAILVEGYKKKKSREFSDYYEELSNLYSCIVTPLYNPNKAFYWVKKGVKNNYRQCKHLMMEYYLGNEICQKNIVKAISLANQNLDDPRCKVELIRMLINDTPHKDVDRAITLCNELKTEYSFYESDVIEILIEIYSIHKVDKSKAKELYDYYIEKFSKSVCEENINRLKNIML